MIKKTKHDRTRRNDVQMISQGTSLWAAAIEYVEGSKTGRDTETVTSTGKVIGWTTEGDPGAPVLALVAWFSGPQVLRDGSAGTPSLDLGERTVIGYGETPNDAATAARHLMQDHINAWRAGPTTGPAAIEPPDATVVLAARHLDATEGRAWTGTRIDPTTRSAIDQVIGYVAKAHNTRRDGGV
jgi:hypothetical protein